MINRIVYGGAFDPPHLGHVESVQAVLQHIPSAQLLVVPSRHPAVVSGKHKNPTASYEQRMEMCEIAFLQLDPQKRVVVSDIESDTQMPWYTINTLKKLEKIFPSDQLWLMIGQDQLQAFARWHQPLEILKRAGIIAVRRQYSDQHKETLPSLFLTLQSSFDALGLPFDWDASTSTAQIKKINSTVILLDENVCPAESSNIRGELEHSIQLGGRKIPKDVFSYIQSHHLYELDK